MDKKSLSEQELIIRKVDQLMTLCDELEHSIQQNQKYTQEFIAGGVERGVRTELALVYGRFL